ncbi:MAG: DNA-3-methyladenine glycosylase 2 family protein [Rhizobiales bacterium]|nr:DNA-3-methyladenine glycosylase 2 family protein [Hyphomicrobiales bacterium]
MLQHIETPQDIEQGVKLLIANDQRLAHVHRMTGLPPLRRQPGGFPALLYMITEQMISLKAAHAIWQRVEAAFHPFDPAVMANAAEEDYRACGLSGPKLNAMRSLATAIAEGSLDCNKLPDLADADVIVQLTRIKGIGDWTAQIYLLACLGRPDAWPAGDVALQIAMQHALDLSSRPTAREMATLARDWRPLRAIAARLLWAYYRHLK